MPSIYVVVGPHLVSATSLLHKNAGGGGDWSCVIVGRGFSAENDARIRRSSAPGECPAAAVRLVFSGPSFYFVVVPCVVHETSFYSAPCNCVFAGFVVVVRWVMKFDGFGCTLAVFCGTLFYKPSVRSDGGSCSSYPYPLHHVHFKVGSVLLAR